MTRGGKRINSGRKKLNRENVTIEIYKETHTLIKQFAELKNISIKKYLENYANNQKESITT